MVTGDYKLVYFNGCGTGSPTAVGSTAFKVTASYSVQTITGQGAPLSTFSIGDTVNLIWNAPTNHSTTDCIRMYGAYSLAATANGSTYGYQGQSVPVPSPNNGGQLSFTAPSVTGSYKLVYFKGCSTSQPVASIAFTIGSGTYSLTSSKSVFSPGETMQIGFTAPVVQANDTFYGYAIDGSGTFIGDYIPTGSPGTFAVTAPTTPGVHEIVYWANDSPCYYGGRIQDQRDVDFRRVLTPSHTHSSLLRRPPPGAALHFCRTTRQRHQRAEADSLSRSR